LTSKELPGSLTAAGSFRSRTMVFFSVPKPWPASHPGYKRIKPISGNLRISRPRYLVIIALLNFTLPLERWQAKAPANGKRYRLLPLLSTR
jgi:hypothetical protein